MAPEAVIRREERSLAEVVGLVVLEAVLGPHVVEDTGAKRRFSVGQVSTA
jgi:hypothetical protein